MRPAAEHGGLNPRRPAVNGKKHGGRDQWINNCDPKTSQYIGETVIFEGNLRGGPSRSWWNTGQLSAEGDYDHDEKHGTWKTHYSDGSPMKTIVYDHGKKVSQVDHRP